MYDDTDSTLISAKLPCEKCGSSDAKAHYSNGWAHCFSCGANTRWEDDMSESKADFEAEPDTSGHGLITGLDMSGIPARSLSQAMCRKYGYGLGKNYAGQKVHVANVYDLKGKLVAQKTRDRNKGFAWLGDQKAAEPLWGMHLFSPSHSSAKSWETMVVITEGEIDALTTAELLGGKRAVVSLLNGANAAVKSVTKALEWLDRFDKIILMFDMDEPGRAAVEAVASILPVGKAFVASLPLKDANEMEKAGRGKEVVEAVWSAAPWRPDRVLGGDDLVSSVIDYVEPEGIKWPWESVAKFLPVMQVPSITLFVAGTGAGKTTLMRALEHHILASGERLGIMHLEEPPKKTALGLVGYEIKRKLNFGTAGVDREELKDAAQRVLSDRLFLYDGFGSIALEVIVSRIRYMAASGCRYIVLDHLSILASGVDGDERKALDIAMTKLRTLCEELKVAMFVVVHIKRGSNAAEGGDITDEDIRGSQGIAQLADTIITVRRNKKAVGWKQNLILLSCIKNREWGREGEMACLLYGEDGHFILRPATDWHAEDVEDNTAELTEAPQIDGEVPF